MSTVAPPREQPLTPLDRRSAEDGVLEVLRELLAEIRGGPPPAPVALDDLLDRDLGLGSLERVELLLRLEKRFGLDLPDAVLAEAERGRDLVAALVRGSPRAPERPLRPPPRPASATPAPESARTLVEALRARVEAEPGRTHIVLRAGSTGDPKGVLLTHANILANLRAIGQAIGVRPDDVGVSWLPLYHDMGLIGCWLGALYFGIPIVLLSPLAFLSHPARWLQAIHAHQGTLSPAPNFAFDLCAHKIPDEELEGLDLRSWHVAFNGSETVSPDTLERFSRRFAPHGFRPEAMCPVYGLAEASVGLTISPVGRGPRVDRVAREPFERGRAIRPAVPAESAPVRFVSCGRPLPDHDVRIVDAAGRPVAERVEGGVEFKGPSVTPGYFHNPEATRAVRHDT